MKKLIPLLLAVLLLAGCAAGYDGPTREKQVIAEFTKELHSSVTDRVDHERLVYTYDIYGNIAQSLEYRNGEETAKTVYTYDERGNLLTETRYDISGWFPQRSRHCEYTYDEKNRLTAELCEDVQYEYIFDDGARTCTRLENGVVTELICYDDSGEVLSKTAYDGNYWLLTEYTRDDQGRPLVTRSTDSDGLERIWRSEYDEHGNTIYHEAIENGTRTEQRRTYEYDELGRPLREYEIRDGIPVELCRWAYLDDYGSYDLWRGGLRSYTRICDAQGREIERIHYIDGTDLVGIREVTVYRTIQVPEEETP